MSPLNEDKFWDELERRNTGEFWKVEPGEADKPSAVENLLDTVTMPKVPEPTKTRARSHRARRTRGGRVWVPVLVGSLFVGSFGAVALWQSQDATLPSEKTSLQNPRVVTVTPKPIPVPGPLQTRWRTRKVEVPGPTVTKTKTVTPAPLVSIKTVPAEPDILISIRPGPTVTVTETEESYDGYPFE